MKKNWSLLFGLAILTASVAVGCQSGNPFNSWGGPPPNPYATQAPYQQAPYQQAAPGGYGATQQYGNAPSYGAPASGPPSGYNSGGYGGQPMGSGAAGGNMGSGSY